jgi:Abortive infection C-terminus/Protein of unknown function (DUF3085)
MRETESLLRQSLDRKLARPKAARLRADWRKASARLASDPDGAMTAARTFLETTCKLVLDETGVQFDPAAELPKLYSQAALKLGVGPATQTVQLFRSIFGAAHTVVNSVCALRNNFGDAHGKGKGSLTPSPAQASLAVNLAGSVGSFLLVTLESHLTATRRLDSKGRAVLRFDKNVVWRIRDHAKNSPKFKSSYGKRGTKPELWLVGDAGVYLMSNGEPPISYKGEVPRTGREAETPYLAAYAHGCDPSQYEMEQWWPIHNSVAEGSDFVIPIPLTAIDKALAKCNSEIVIVVGRSSQHLYTDVQYDRQ